MIDVVPTLDSELSEARSTVWCASFQEAWTALRRIAGGEAITLEGSDGVVESLNSSRISSAELPESSHFADAGRAQDGVVARIQKRMAELFPAFPTPSLPSGALVAYAYLEAGFKFRIPYFDNQEPMIFAGSDGFKVEAKSFGLCEQHEYAYDQLRDQVDILHVSESDDLERVSNPEEFVLDLDRYSRPTQVLLALIPKQRSLADALVYRDTLIAGSPGAPLGDNDTLLVPNISLSVTARFSQIEGRPIRNPEFEGQAIDVAEQTVNFRLDRGGAELRSESKLEVLPIPTHFVFDRPFLLSMSNRGASSPFLAIWVAGPEPLQQF